MRHKGSVPFVHIEEKHLTFFVGEDVLIDSPRLLVSKSTERVIFRASRTSQGFKVTRDKRWPNRAYITSQMLCQYIGLKCGTRYQLFPCDDGFYIKRYEPLEGGGDVEPE